jgi:hypothetical protein
MTLGPLIGSALLKVDFALVAYLSASLYVVALIVTWRLLPDVKVGRTDQSLTSGVKQVVRDRPFMILVALLMGYWFMWVQLTLSVPLRPPRSAAGGQRGRGVCRECDFHCPAGAADPLLESGCRRCRRWWWAWASWRWRWAASR